MAGNQTYNVHTDLRSFLRTDNPMLYGYWRLGDSLPPVPPNMPSGIFGSGAMTDDSLHRMHLTHGGLAPPDFQIVPGLVPYDDGGSGLKLNFPSPTSDRLYVSPTDVSTSVGNMFPNAFARDSGMAICGWISVPVSTGNTNGHILNTVENAESMVAEDVFFVAWDGTTSALKFGIRTAVGPVNEIVRASQFPTIPNSGMFFCANLKHNIPIGPSIFSSTLELYIGDSSTSGVTLAASSTIADVITNDTDATKPLAIGIKSNLASLSTSDHLPSGSIVDDLSLWGTSLTIEQMEFIKNSGIIIGENSFPIGSGVPPVNPGESGLVAQWRFEDNSSLSQIGVNSFSGTADRLNLITSVASEVTPINSKTECGNAARQCTIITEGNTSGIEINSEGREFPNGMSIGRNSGINLLFPAKEFGDFTFIGWRKSRFSPFRPWSLEWVNSNIVGPVRPSTHLCAQGLMGSDGEGATSTHGGGFIMFDGSGSTAPTDQLRNVRTTDPAFTADEQASRDIPQNGEWNLFAGVWDNTNSMVYIIKDAITLIAWLPMTASGASRSNHDTGASANNPAFKMRVVTSTTQDGSFDEWAVFNRVLTLPEMSGYALSGTQPAVEVVPPEAPVAALFDTPDPRLLAYWPLDNSGSYGNLGGFRMTDSGFYRHHLDNLVGDLVSTTPIDNNAGAGETNSLQILSSGSHVNLDRFKIGANLDFSQRELWPSGWSAGLWIDVPSGGTLRFDANEDIPFMGCWDVNTNENRRSWLIATSGGKLSARVSMDGITSGIVDSIDLPLDSGFHAAMTAERDENGTIITLFRGTSGVDSVAVAQGHIGSFDFDKSSNSGIVFFALPSYQNFDGSGSNFAGCPSGTRLQSAFVFAENIQASGISNIKEATVNKIELQPISVGSSDPANISHWKLDRDSALIRDFGKEQNFLIKAGLENAFHVSGIHNSGTQIDELTWYQTEPLKGTSRLDLGSGATSFTLMGWVSTFELPEDQTKTIVAKENPSGVDSSQSGYRLLARNVFLFNDGTHASSGNNSPIETASGETTSAWHHVAYVYNRISDQTVMIVNGRYAGTTFDQLGTIKPNSSGFSLGGNSVADGVVTVNGGFFSGIMDDWLAFERPLTIQEISGIAADSYNFVESSGQFTELVGGYVSGIPAEIISGLVGGFLAGKAQEFNLQGGFLSGIQGEITPVGGFVHGKFIASGLQGGFVHGFDQASGLIGAFVRGSDTASGLIGAFTFGACEAQEEFDVTFIFNVITSQDFDARLAVEVTDSKDFDARIAVVQITSPPFCEIVSPISGLVIPDGPPFTLTLQASGQAFNNKNISQVRFTFGDFTENISGVLISGVNNEGVFESSHTYLTPGFYTPKIEILDEFGYRTSCCYQFLLLPSGVSSGTFIDSLPSLNLIGVPESGATKHRVSFTTLASGAPILIDYLDFADGQSTLVNSTEMPDNGPFAGTVREHLFTVPGTFCVVHTASGVSGITSDAISVGSDVIGF